MRIDHKLTTPTQATTAKKRKKETPNAKRARREHVEKVNNRSPPFTVGYCYPALIFRTDAQRFFWLRIKGRINLESRARASCWLMNGLGCCVCCGGDYALFVCVCAVDAAERFFGAVDDFVVGAFVDLAVAVGAGVEQDFKGGGVDFGEVSKEVAA